MIKALAALAFSSLFVFACSSSGDGTSGDSDPSASDDASKAADRDAGSSPGTDAGSPIVDAAIDVSLPPLPPAFTQCTTCMETTCEPEIAACDADPYCTELLQCALESGCLQDGSGATCVSTCGSSLGLTQKQILQETKLLEQMATSCASCLTECPKPDASLDGG